MFFNMVYDMDILFEYLSVLSYLATIKKYDDAINELISMYI